VVVLARKPKSVEDLEDMLFTSTQKEIGITKYDFTCTTKDICESVFRSIKTKRGIKSVRTLKAELSGLGYSWADSYGYSYKNAPKEKDYSTRKEYLIAESTFYNELEKSSKQIEKYTAQNLLKDYPDSFIFSVDYGDDSRFESVMEHGGIFRNAVEVIRISHH